MLVLVVSTPIEATKPIGFTNHEIFEVTQKFVHESEKDVRYNSVICLGVLMKVTNKRPELVLDHGGRFRGKKSGLVSVAPVMFPVVNSPLYLGGGILCFFSLHKVVIFKSFFIQ